MPDKKDFKSITKKNIAVYLYRAPNGAVVAEKVRYEDKSFIWRVPKPDGSYDYHKPQDALLYGLPALAASPDGATVYIAEGEKDVDTLTALDKIAVCTPDGAGSGKFKSTYATWFKDKVVVILGDNDDVGKAYQQEEAAAIAGFAREVKVVELTDLWTEMPEHGDITDLLEHQGESAMSDVEQLVEQTPVWQRSSASNTDTGMQLVSAAELENQYLPDAEFIVNALLSVGLAILASKPKIGKSFFVLDLCLAIATGRDFLGFHTRRGEALYLALEDTAARLKHRQHMILQGDAAPEGLYYMTSAHRLGNGLLDDLEKILAEHPQICLIAIDTFQLIRGTPDKNTNIYVGDYNEMHVLKAFADRHNICLLLVHHTRKAENANDEFDEISGSTAILGAVDVALQLKKDNRMDDKVKLAITGRDVEQNEWYITRDKQSCRWSMEGDATAISEEFNRRRYDEDEVVMAVKQAVALGHGTWRGTMSQLNTVAANTPEIGHMLSSPRKLAAQIKTWADDLLRYDGIAHEVEPNGTGGGKHIFTKGNNIVATVDTVATVDNSDGGEIQ